MKKIILSFIILSITSAAMAVDYPFGGKQLVNLAPATATNAAVRFDQMISSNAVLQAAIDLNQATSTATNTLKLDITGAVATNLTIVAPTALSAQFTVASDQSPYAGTYDETAAVKNGFFIYKDAVDEAYLFANVQGNSLWWCLDSDTNLNQYFKCDYYSPVIAGDYISGTGTGTATVSSVDHSGEAALVVDGVALVTGAIELEGPLVMDHATIAANAAGVTEFTITPTGEKIAYSIMVNDSGRFSIANTAVGMASQFYRSALFGANKGTLSGSNAVDSAFVDFLDLSFLSFDTAGLGADVGIEHRLQVADALLVGTNTQTGVVITNGSVIAQGTNLLQSIAANAAKAATAVQNGTNDAVSLVLTNGDFSVSGGADMTLTANAGSGTITMDGKILGTGEISSPGATNTTPDSVLNVTAIDLRFAEDIAAISSSIFRHPASGGRTEYIPSADTDTARGAALTEAFGDLLTNDTLYVQGGSYLSDGLTIGVPCSVTFSKNAVLTMADDATAMGTGLGDAVPLIKVTSGGVSISGGSLIGNQAGRPATSATRHCAVYSDGYSGLVVDDITATDFRNYGVFVMGSDLVVKNCLITNCDNGIRVGQTSTLERLHTNILIDNNTVDFRYDSLDTDIRGIKLMAGHSTNKNVIISGNRIFLPSQPDDSTWRLCIEVFGPDNRNIDCLVSGNITRGGQMGISIGSRGKRMNVADNVISLAAEYGIEFESDGGICSDNIVTMDTHGPSFYSKCISAVGADLVVNNNLLRGGYHGVAVGSGSQGAGNVIVSSNIILDSVYGSYVERGSTGIIVSLNIFDTVSRALRAMNADQVIMANNIFRNVATIGIEVKSSGDDATIPDNTSIVGNLLTDNISNPMSVYGQGFSMGDAIHASGNIFDDARTVNKDVASPMVITATGAGSPENFFFAKPGSIYYRTDGGSNSTIYIKESGTSKTGWIAK